MLIRPIKIGSLELKNNLILAPLAGITDLPVRLLSRAEGASLCFTEMVSVNGLVREGKKTFDLVRSCAEDRPLGIQVFGDEPETTAEGVALVEAGGDLVDLNMGCPVRKVVGAGSGAALMREPVKVRDMIRQVRRRTALPLTIKFRSGWTADEINYLEIGRIAQEEGCDAVTLHPRTRAQMFEGKSDWTHLRRLKETLRIPVIGSGDLFTPDDVLSMLRETGCDGVMLARGAMGNPWLFRQTLQLGTGSEPQQPSRMERLTVALRHFDLMRETLPDLVAVREMRKHVSWYAKGISGAATFRSRVNTVSDPQEFRQLLDDFFGDRG